MMIGIDTNIIVRLLVVDDPGQARRAQALIEANDVFVPRSVILEAEWVLRSAYGRSKLDVVKALKEFLRLPRVTAEARAETLRALDWVEQGMDIADALHLSAVAHCESFASFDRKLARVAERNKLMRVLEP